MPTCKKCQENFPDRMMIDGKERILKSRSYCLACSPFGSRHGYGLRKVHTIETRSNTKECPICNHEFKYTKNNVCSTCRKEWRRYINKLTLIEHAGGCCKRCSESDPACLTFHHIDETTKVFNISSSLHKAIEYLIVEVDKCELLCANCHFKHHYNDKQRLIDYYQKD